MQYRNVNELIRKLSLLSKTEATKKLTEFYAKARFKITPEEFDRKYVDGKDDGGIDFYYNEDTTFFVFQAKFTEKSKRTSATEIFNEIRKLKNTLAHENPNRKADSFVNSLRREVKNKDAILEILWLTTNIVEPSVREEIQKDLDEWKKENEWSLAIDFVAIDKYALENTIYDVKHGYIPYTGKKILKLQEGEWIESEWEETHVYSIICSVNINDILEWFHDSDEIDRFLQKNVREFLGETTKINKAIAKSYSRAPIWFWYKHNGIIIFADNVYLDKTKKELVLRNPQVVNGGQTLKALFSAYDKNGRKDSPAKILLRIYRLPYEDTKTYKRSIEIIAALNSQHQIRASDLKSTDPRQVRLEQLFENLGAGYKYLRKRSKEAISGRYSITMRNLAIRYYVCKKIAPHEGVKGNVEELFEEDSKYDYIFNEKAINRDMANNHIIINYVTTWAIDQILKKVNMPKKDKEYSQYTKWFVLVDVYNKLIEWKQKKFELGWRSWINFIETSQFEKAISDYARRGFRTGREIIPTYEEPRAFFKSKDTWRKFSSKRGKRDFETLINKAYVRSKDKV